MRLSLVAALVAALTLLSGIARAEDARTAVKQKITLKKGIEANTPLKEALEFLGASYKVTITLDEKAFADAGVAKVAEAPVKLAPQKDAPLIMVLQRLADQVKGTCAVDKDGVTIAPKRKNEADQRINSSTFRRPQTPRRGRPSLPRVRL